MSTKVSCVLKQLIEVNKSVLKISLSSFSENMSVCRTCGGSQNLTSISEVEGLKDLLLILVSIEDIPGFPLICWKCVTKVQDFDDFRSKCRETDLKLRQADIENEDYTADLSRDSSPETAEEPQGKLTSCFCGREYSSKRNLTRHQRQAHTTSLPTQECSFCGEQVPIHSLKIHLASHVKSRSFSCDICGAVFHHKEPLRGHMQTQHIAYRGFVCDKCPKQFKTPSALNEHKRTHDFNRLIECSLCSKQFVTKKGLDRHKASTHGEGLKKSFPCETCGRSFTSRYVLTCHKRQHTDERPYACSYESCQKRFRQLTSLRKHTHSHKGTRPFNCPVAECGTGYYNSAYLKSHMLKTHNLEYEPKPRFPHHQYGLCLTQKTV